MRRFEFYRVKRGANLADPAFWNQRLEDLDLRILNAMGEGKGRSLTDLPKGALNSGSSEIRNWILVAGAIEKMKKRWFEYQALYRQAAGTGIGVAFGVWEN